MKSFFQPYNLRTSRGFKEKNCVWLSSLAYCTLRSRGFRRSKFFVVVFSTIAHTRKTGGFKQKNLVVSFLPYHARESGNLKNVSWCHLFYHTIHVNAKLSNKTSFVKSSFQPCYLRTSRGFKEKNFVWSSSLAYCTLRSRGFSVAKFFVVIFSTIVHTRKTGGFI